MEMAKDTLLISCPGGDGGLFMLKGATCVRLSPRATTGLFVSDGRLLMAYQGAGGKSLRVIAEDRAEEILLDANPLDLHDVLFVDGKIYVVGTETNSVICFDQGFQKLESWGLPGENDASHINSVAVYQGKLLASIFGRFRHHREYKLGTMGRGEVVDIKTGETFIGGLSQPHSLTVVGDLLYLCSSEEGKLMIYRGSQVVGEVALSGYARGLAVSDDSLYVGISLSRNAENYPNYSGSSVVMVLDKDDQKLIRSMPLPCSEIYDIRIVNDVCGIFPDLLVDMVEEKKKIEDDLGHYRNGYESYKSACAHYESYKTAYEHVLKCSEIQQRELDDALRQLECHRRSLSWRMTKPLRYLESLVGKKD